MRITSNETYSRWLHKLFEHVQKIRTGYTHKTNAVRMDCHCHYHCSNDYEWPGMITQTNSNGRFVLVRGQIRVELIRGMIIWCRVYQTLTTCLPEMTGYDTMSVYFTHLVESTEKIILLIGYPMRIIWFFMDLIQVITWLGRFKSALLGNARQWLDGIIPAIKEEFIRNCQELTVEMLC